MEVIGKVKFKGEVQTFGNDFTKKELVITTDEQYPQHISIEFVKDKIELLDKYKLGDNVKVSINIRGREWVNPQGETKYFNSIQGWRIENALTEAEINAGVEQAKETINKVMPPTEKDDLPF